MVSHLKENQEGHD